MFGKYRLIPLLVLVFRELSVWFLFIIVLAFSFKSSDKFPNPRVVQYFSNNLYIRYLLFLFVDWPCWEHLVLVLQLAQQNAKMDLFADIVGEGATPEDYHRFKVVGS